MKLLTCSRPLSGESLSNHSCGHGSAMLSVLVPFRGNHYQIMIYTALLDNPNKFSSPFGGIIIKSMLYQIKDPKTECSRPLSGESLSNQDYELDYLGEYVLVPFRGNHYQIADCKDEWTWQVRSRPLSGESL